MSDGPLKREVATRFQPFLDETLSTYLQKIHSIHIYGSALTSDYNPGSSDINSIFVLHKMDFEFLETLAPLGKKYGKKKLAAPLIMTPDYIQNSVDVFPIEFLNIKMFHHTVHGQDLFPDINIKQSDLRHQCERELKAKLIGLRQGYLSSAADTRRLTEGFMETFAGYIPLFRSIIVLFDRQPPESSSDVLTTLQAVTGVNTEVFIRVLHQKNTRQKQSITQLNTIFEDYYRAVEELGEVTDAIEL